MKTMSTILLFMVVLVAALPCGSAWAVEGMVSYWRFDEGEGITAFDSVGDNDGTIYGPTWTTGFVNSALSFDGVDDYVNVGNDTTLTNLTPTGMAIEAWVFNTEPIPTDGGYYKSIVTQWEGLSQGYGLQYGYESKYDMGHFVWIGFFYGYEGIANYEIKANEWHHIVGAFENDVATIYINGIV